MHWNCAAAALRIKRFVFLLLLLKKEYKASTAVVEHTTHSYGFRRSITFKV
jgi:hypothetical protein